MKKAPAMDSPSGRALEHASRLDLHEIGTCGGDKIRVKIWRKVSVFIGIYGGGISVRRCRWAPNGLGACPTLLGAPGGRVGPL